MRAALALAVLGLLPACGSRRPPDVVLIVLDTVRADHLSCYGYGRPTTPNLDALAARADRYTRVRATGPWTLPSHASLFTGEFPHEHGVDGRAGSGAGAFALAPEVETLAERLAARGYRTGAFVANVAHVNPRGGFDQGFETFFNENLRAPELGAKALAWLDEAADEDERRPVFLFLNFMDAHRKYNVAPLPPERARELPPPPSYDVGGMLDLFASKVLGGAEPAPELRDLVVDAYDLGLANLDAGLGELFAGLERRGLLGGALIVVTADHGEFLGEHDLVEHAKDVYEPVLHVPLVVKRPGADDGRVLDEPLSLADVPRLVLAHAGAGPLPPERQRAELLAELAAGAGQRNRSAPFAERFARDRVVLYDGEWKLIHSSDGRHELYDLAADPGEQNDVFSERPDVAEALLRRLLAATADRRTSEGPPPTPLSEEALQELRDLGY